MHLHRAGGWFCIVLALTTGLAKASSWELEPPLACGETVTLRFESAPYFLEEQADDTVVVRIPDGDYRFMNGGDPQIPFELRRIDIPKNCEAAVELVKVEISETNSPSIQPVPAMEAREAHGSQHVEQVPAKPSSVYEADSFWPPDLIEIRYATQGARRWATVVINPVQYNPVRGILRWNKHIEARLTWREPLASE